MKQNTESEARVPSEYERMGLEVQLESIKRVMRMLDAMAARIQAELHEIDAAQNAATELLVKPATVRGRRGRPPKLSSGWPADPKARRAEMARRRAKWKPTVKIKKAKKNEAWDGMTPKEQKALISKMNGKAKQTNGSPEAAA